MGSSGGLAGSGNQARRCSELERERYVVRMSDYFRIRREREPPCVARGEVIVEPDVAMTYQTTQNTELGRAIVISSAFLLPLPSSLPVAAAPSSY